VRNAPVSRKKKKRKEQSHVRIDVRQGREGEGKNVVRERGKARLKSSSFLTCQIGGGGER